MGKLDHHAIAGMFPALEAGVVDERLFVALRVESCAKFAALVRYAEESFSDVGEHEWNNAA